MFRPRLIKRLNELDPDHCYFDREFAIGVAGQRGLMENISNKTARVVIKRLLRERDAQCEYPTSPPRN